MDGFSRGAAGRLCSAAGTPYLKGGETVSMVKTTVPGNGDVNPYGIAVVLS